MFAKGLLGYLPANILQGLIGFASLMVFTRLLSPDDYGRYAMAFGVTSLGHTIAFTWLEAAMARFYPVAARDNTEAPVLFGTLYRLFAVIAALMATVTLIVALWPVTNASAHALKWAMVSGLVSAIFRSLCKLVMEQRRSEGRVRAAAALDMLQTAGGFAIGAGLCALGLGASAPLLGAGIIAAIALPLFAREDWRRAIKGRFDAPSARIYAHYGLPISLSLILTLSLYTVDRFLVAHYLSDGDAGAYHAGVSLASRLIDVLFIWLGAAGGPALVHEFENGGSEALNRAARKQVTTMAFFTFPAVAGLIAVAPALGSLMIGEGLRDRAISITPLIALGGLCSGFNSYYFLQAFTLAKKTRHLMACMAVPAVANIALNLALIPPMGLMGAALAGLIAFALGSVTAILIARKTGAALPLPLMDLSRTALASAAMLCLVCAIPAIPLPEYVPLAYGTIIELIVKSASGAALYAAFAWGMNLNETRRLTGRLLRS